MTRTARLPHVSPAVPPQRARQAFIPGSFDARQTTKVCAGVLFGVHASNVRRNTSPGTPSVRGNCLALLGEFGEALF